MAPKQQHGNLTTMTNPSKTNLTIKEFQKLIYDRYYETDSARGIAKTFLWLSEEYGELATDLAKLERGDANPEALASEFADVLAWLATLANLAGIDLETALRNKYINQDASGDPK